ncbi:MAG: nitrogen regulation protein NR(II) [Candidatus Scalindua sp.]
MWNINDFTVNNRKPYFCRFVFIIMCGLVLVLFCSVAEAIDTLKGFIYDPNPEPEYKWAYWTFGIAVVILLIIGVYIAILFVFNRRLHHDIQLRTSELTLINKTLVQEASERKKAEEALQKSESKYRRLSQEFHTLLDAIDDPMIQISPELKILWANRSAATFSGNDISRLQGKYCYKLWFNRNSPCDNCPAIEKCFQTGEAGSIQLSTPDGRFCSLKAFPVKDEVGKVHNVIEIYNDITKEMIMQEESTRAAQMATLGELAASVAHEINNPVYGITMCAQSLLAETRNGKIKDYDVVKMIVKESDRIANVTRCLLSAVRDSEDIKSLCDIYEILSDTLSITRVIIQKEGIKLRTDVPKDMPLILAYHQQIQQVFLNILNNARYTLNKKYPDTDENKIIEVTGQEIMIDDCPYNQIIFYDRGMGIAADKIDNVLNPFFTTKPRGKGTGLGLSISNKIIKDHDGKIEIDSVEGEFTKIIITLPVAR